MSGSGDVTTGAKSKAPLLVAVVVPLLVLVGVAVASVLPSVSNVGYEPEQPIPFSHKLHAGQYKMACMYCHVGPEKSRHSTVPSVGICMNCHTVVKTDSPHIKKLHQHYKEGTPIEWIRVHELPDHASFPHNRHIAAGLACQTCHGEVQNMEKVYQYSDLTMGWCLDCHRGKTTPADVLKKLGTDEHGNVAPISCSTCHY